MSDTGGPTGDSTPGRARLRVRVRFAPQVIVLLVAAALAFPALRGTVGAGVWWWWGPTYRQVDFVMTEASPNDGSPLVRGHLEPGGAEAVLEARARPGGFVLESDPTVAFHPGARVRVWWSESAPIVGLGPGRSTGYQTASSMPRLPGLASLAGYVLWIAAVGAAALWVLERLRLRTRVYTMETTIGR